MIELSPYHSKRFKLSTKILNSLRSSRLAKAFVHEVVGPKVKIEESLLIVTRAAKKWELPQDKNIIIYSSSEARSAHLILHGRGGEALVQFMQSIYKEKNS